MSENPSLFILYETYSSRSSGIKLISRLSGIFIFSIYLNTDTDILKITLTVITLYSTMINNKLLLINLCFAIRRILSR